MGALEWVTTKAKALLPDSWRSDVTIVPVVRLTGPIGTVMPFSSGMSISGLAEPLERAFEIKKAPAVALIVNSPGGSPVQSRLIYERIRALADEHEKPVLVFVEDAAASGGYMIACAGDEIFVDPSSIVGSIGVVASGFGFTDLIAKLGIERRVYTAGEKKVTLDAFKPEVPEDVAHIISLQAEIHETFIDLVRERRGAKLKPDSDLFSGSFWTGKRGVDLGLVDAIGDIRGTLRARFGDEVKLKLISQSRGFFPGRPPKGDISGAWTAIVSHASLSETLLGTAEARGLWSRLGL
jgi:signal peptide peptidase SppA